MFNTSNSTKTAAKNKKMKARELWLRGRSRVSLSRISRLLRSPKTPTASKTAKLIYQALLSNTQRLKGQMERIRCSRSSRNSKKSRRNMVLWCNRVKKKSNFKLKVTRRWLLAFMIPTWWENKLKVAIQLSGRLLTSIFPMLWISIFTNSPDSTSEMLWPK